MIAVRDAGGLQIEIDETKIVLIAGPYPHNVGPHTYIYGVTAGVLLTLEPPQALIERLTIKPPLVRLTRPNFTPVWINGAAATSVRTPLPAEIPAFGAVGAVITLGSLHQAVCESVETIKKDIKVLRGDMAA